ncbi:MAG: hypothetical protein HY851_01240 [candidate division Zixibacteria bacterium]|nr:hypothetical protein [candidate division Zixibacteria bacterium]
MRTRILVALAIVFALGSTAAVCAGETEREIVNRYVKKFEKKRIKHTGWLSLTFNLNRLNRDNDYNKFATYQNSQFTGATFKWLNTGQIFGADFGAIIYNKLAFTIGGEYWMTLGQSFQGTYTYTPPVGASTQITDPASSISVHGLVTGLQYYILNHPYDLVGHAPTNKPVVKVTGQVGFYRTSWKLWSQYENMNLSTASPEPSNTSFTGSAAGLIFGMGVDYPLKVAGLSLGVDMNYLWLNFKKVSWYNSADQEVVASWNGTPQGRIVMGLSGVRGRIELKKHFTW